MTKLLLGLLGFLVLVLLGYGIYVYSQNAAKIDPNPQTSVNNQLSAPDPVASMTLREKILSLMILHTPGKTPEEVLPFVKRYQPAGLILMSDNVSNNLSQITDLTNGIQKVAKYPLLISIDQEGCSVKRIMSDSLPCAQDLKNKSPEDTKKAFTQRSSMLKSVGVNLNFGIVADITKDTKSFIYPRVFGSDPTIVSTHVTQAIEGSKPYVLSTIKHFPGHGQTAEDSHTSVPKVTISKSEWEKYDAIPFKRGIEAQSEFVMMSHLIYTQVDQNPATLSKKWHDILRNELRFNGIIITDDLIMLQKSGVEEYADVGINAIRALKADNDILLYVNEYNLEEEPVRKIDIDKLVSDIEKAVQKGEISEKKIDEKVKKVLEVRKTLSK